MSKERWQYIKNLGPSAPRYIHISKPLYTDKDGHVKVSTAGITYRKVHS